MDLVARDQRPWTILDHYLVVKYWTPNFDPLMVKTKKLIVWVRIPCLPIEYFNFAFLKKVEDKIGKTIRAGHNIRMTVRGRFGRLCVDVDITKSLLTMFKLKKIIRRIEYKGIHLVCFECGVVRHKKEECTKIKPENVSREGQVAGDQDDVAVNGEAHCRKVQITKDTPLEINREETFGPWIIAQKKENIFGRRNRGRKIFKENQGEKEGKSNAHTTKIKAFNGLELNSRYNALYGLEETEDDVESPNGE